MTLIVRILFFCILSSLVQGQDESDTTTTEAGEESQVESTTLTPTEETQMTFEPQTTVDCVSNTDMNTCPPCPTAIPETTTTCLPCPTTTPEMMTSCPPCPTTTPEMMTSCPPCPTTVCETTTSCSPCPTTVCESTTSCPPCLTVAPETTTSCPPCPTFVPETTTSCPSCEVPETTTCTPCETTTVQTCPPCMTALPETTTAPPARKMTPKEICDHLDGNYSETLCRYVCKRHKPFKIIFEDFMINGEECWLGGKKGTCQPGLLCKVPHPPTSWW